MTTAQVAGLPHVPIEENFWMTFIKIASEEKRTKNPPYRKSLRGLSSDIFYNSKKIPLSDE